MSKKIKVNAGDLFVVPIAENMYAVGLVGKISNKYFIGYFFKTVYITNDLKQSELELNNCEIIIYQMLTLSILSDGKWPIIRKGMFKNIVDAPMPKFKHYDTLRKENYIVELDDELKELQRYPSDLPLEEWEKLSEDGLAGSGFMEKVLANLLLKGNL